MLLNNLCFHAECDEHDARDQRAILADEGQPSVMDPEGLPVQRSGSNPTPPHPAASQTDEMLTLTVGFIVFPAAKVACVKSRDMHWALVAHKDQKDINLSSLRMLLVADGSNPCKFPLRLYRQVLLRTENFGSGCFRQWASDGGTLWGVQETGSFYKNRTGCVQLCRLALTDVF